MNVYSGSESAMITNSVRLAEVDDDCRCLDQSCGVSTLHVNSAMHILHLLCARQPTPLH